MKILVSLSYYLPYISGLSVYAQRLAEGLAKNGHQLTVITSRHDKSLPKKEMVNKVEVNRIWSPLKLNKGIIMPTWPIASLKAVAQSDTVICHLPQVEALWVLFWAKLLNKKSISVYHCDVNLPPGKITKLISLVLVTVNHFCLNLTDVVVNSSDDYATHSLVLKHYLHKLKVIYPPIVVLSKKITKKQLPKSFYQKKVKVGFVGRMAAEKGIEYLLETIPLLQKKLSAFGIFIVGPQDPVGEDKYIEKIKLLINRYQSNVIILGKLTDNQLSEFYQDINLLVLPSLNSTEAFGMVQVEAMLYGVPVIATDLPGVRFAVSATGMGLIVKPGDSVSLAQAILKVCHNRTYYIRSSNKIKALFNVGKTASFFDQIITAKT